MRELKPCPCGEVPFDLVIEGTAPCKYAWVSGDCCSEWSIEFRSNYKELDSQECINLAIQAWNGAKRASNLAT